MGVAMAPAIRRERAGGHFLGEKGANFCSKRLAFRRQANLVEAEISAHRTLPRRQQWPEIIAAALRNQIA